jgi:hypothetical protein
VREIRALNPYGDLNSIFIVGMTGTGFDSSDLHRFIECGENVTTNKPIPEITLNEILCGESDFPLAFD